MRDEGNPELERNWQYRHYTKRHMGNHVGIARVRVGYTQNFEK